MAAGLIRTLQDLGLTEYEAKAYLALLEDSPLSGYAISKHSGVPRSKIYEVLDSLVRKGAALTSHGDPVQYVPLPAAEFVARRREEMESVLADAESGLDRFAAESANRTAIWDIRGRREILERSRELVRRARAQLLMELWARDADEFRVELQTAAERGVEVVVIAYGDPDYPFATVYQHDSTDSVTNGLGGRWLVVSVDTTEIVAGIVSLGRDSRAAWSSHPGLVVPITELVKHDIYKLEMLGAHRETLEATFGPNLVQLRERFSAFSGITDLS